jgi:hypothetical protein
MRQNVTTPDQGQQNYFANHGQAIATLHPHYIAHLLDVLSNQLSQIAVGQGRGAA